MKSFINIFNNKIKNLNTIDYLIFIIILVLCSILSFPRLGNIYSPNTFHRSKTGETLVIDLNSEREVNKIKLFNGEIVSEYDIYCSDKEDEYKLLAQKRYSSAFSWDMVDFSTYKCKNLKMSFRNDHTIGEIGVYYNDNIIENIKIRSETKELTQLVDEQNLIPERRSYMNSTYFDEIYFARTAYEYVNNLKIYEWTHPPLGKIIQAIPIYITKNMSPFNYRFMGCLSGILIVCVMYIFGTIIFKKRKYGIITAIITFLDTARFSHTRMGTVDSHLILFIILSLLFMYIYVNKKELKYFILSGIFFALSISVKWTGAYSGIALATIYFISLIKEKNISLKSIINGTIFFVIVPIIIYISTFLLFSNNYYKTNNIKNVIRQNEKMYNYHSKLKATHSFSSEWYSWPLSYKPVWYHQEEIDNNYKETISGVGNIVIWYIGILGLIYCLVSYFVMNDSDSIFILICYLSLFLPFASIKRIMFLYHYYPTLPFVYLASMKLLTDIKEKLKLEFFFIVYIFAASIYFIRYYPVVSGIEVEKNYVEKLKIYESWYF